MVEKVLAAGVEGRLWRGLKVCAVDVAKVVLPEAPWLSFGSHKGSRGDGPAQAALALLHDVMLRLPISHRLGAVDCDERALAKKMFECLKAGAALLMDAGFYSVEVFAKLLSRSVHFVIPMRSNGRPRLVKRFGAGDGIHEIRRSHAFEGRKDVPETMLVKIITARKNGFRARRLVTSLTDPAQYPADEIATLYHERWHIETFFRDYKHTLEARRFHANTQKALHVEITFQMILCVLTRLAMAQAAQASGQPPGDISFTDSCIAMKNILEITATLPKKRWPRLQAQLLALLATYKIDKRPGRAFERNRQKRRRQSRERRLAPQHKQNNAA